MYVCIRRISHLSIPFHLIPTLLSATKHKMADLPKAQISTLSLYATVCPSKNLRISGAMKGIDPAICEVVGRESVNLVETPKSAILTRGPRVKREPFSREVSKMFSGLRSRWMMCRSCMADSPWAICSKRLWMLWSSNDDGGWGRWMRVAKSPPEQYSSWR